MNNNNIRKKHKWEIKLSKNKENEAWGNKTEQ